MRDFGITENHASSKSERAPKIFENETSQKKDYPGKALFSRFGRIAGSPYALSIFSVVSLVVTVFAPIGGVELTVASPDVTPPKGDLVITTDPITDEPVASVVEVTEPVEAAVEDAVVQSVKSEETVTDKKASKKKKPAPVKEKKEETTVTQSLFEVNLPEVIAYYLPKDGSSIIANNKFSITVDQVDSTKKDTYTVSTYYYKDEFILLNTTEVKNSLVTAESMIEGLIMPVYEEGKTNYLPFGDHTVRVEVVYPDGTVHSQEKSVHVDRIYTNGLETTGTYIAADAEHPQSLLEIELPLITVDLPWNDLENRYEILVRDISLNGYLVSYDTSELVPDEKMTSCTLKLYNSNFVDIIPSGLSETPALTCVVEYLNDDGTTVYEFLGNLKVKEKDSLHDEMSVEVQTALQTD